MALEMKPECQGYAAPLGLQDEVLICSYECSWCRPCAEGDGMTCRNCGGELVPRPRRKETAV
ncbi:MAG: DUF1272 domain-containing protein [Pseudomonadota bacterium]|nr:DUF1272 domain-containing protein [Pseudomonadota bacterium]